METATEVWLRFKPKLAKAREADRAHVALSFLPIIIPLGRFEIVPLTIERLLWLEQIKSPFVTGAGLPEREDVLAFLWINSPEFRVGEWAGKKFCWNNCLINWRKYSALIGDYMQSVAESMGSDDSKSIQPNWLPELMDAFASQYNWTPEDILKMPVERASILSSAMISRLSEGKNGQTFSPNADKVRGEMLKEIAEAEKAKDGRK